MRAGLRALVISGTPHEATIIDRTLVVRLPCGVRVAHERVDCLVPTRARDVAVRGRQAARTQVKQVQ